MHTYLSVAASTAVSPLAIALVAGGFTLAGVVISQVITVVLQRQSRRAAARAQVETVTAELFDAVFDLQRAVLVHDAQWGVWRPRLMRVGLAALEFLAGRATGSYPEGAVRGARIALDWGDRETAAAGVLLAGPVGRVTAALARVALLSDKAIVDAGMRVAEAVFAVTTAYGDSAMYRKKAAVAARAKADARVAGRAGRCHGGGAGASASDPVVAAHGTADHGVEEDRYSH
jgi:hypothetical protein